MKKILSIILSLVIIVISNMVTAVALSQEITLNGSETVTKGQDVDYTVSISGCPDATSAAVEVSFDSGFSYKSYEWLKIGGIKNFDASKNKGAIGSLNSPDLNGDLFKITFNALTASLSAQTINIKIIVKNGSDEIFNKTATKQITIGCGNNHDYGDLIPEVPAKCGVAGKKAYYKCSSCEKLFTESKVETTETALVITALEHQPASSWSSDSTYHWKTCTRQNCGVVIDSTKAEHSFEWKTDKPATEDETGLKHEECSVCGLKRNENTPISKLDHTHTGITYHAAVAATCKSTGNIEYWTCSSTKCSGKYYSDNLCQNEITTGIITSKDSSNHDGETEYRNSKPATCYAKGYEGDIYCLGCGNKIGTGKDIDMLNHTPGNWETDATYHWKECTVVACGVVIESTKEQHTGGEATCKNKAVCSVCGVEYGEKNADNHKNTTIINAKTPTCTEAGYTGDTYCNDCEKTVANGTSIVPNGHTPSEWQFDDDEHWQTCAVDGCGVEIADSRASHSESEWIVDKEPTVKEEGSKHIECTVCRKVLKTESIAKLIAYEITDGTDGAKCTWTKESKNDLLFTSNAEFSKFVEVKIDGKVIDTNNYYAKAGSTEITLKNSYLETLSDGKHTLTIVSTDGYAETAFEIKEAEKPVTPVSPQTGDNSNLILWISLLIVSFGGLVTLSVPSKKRKVR